LEIDRMGRLRACYKKTINYKIIISFIREKNVSCI